MMTATPIATAQPRHVATVSGRVVSIEVQPHQAAPALTARLSDGTGSIDAVFLGRRDIPGVIPGVRLSVTGRVSAADTGIQIFNPRFELG